MDLFLLKLILLGVMVLMTVVAGLFPVRILKLLRKRAALAVSPKKQRYVSLTLCLLTCFSGGVFLATCFLHLLPELQEHVHMMEDNYKYEFGYPVAELLSCLGFFLLFSIEEVVIILIPSIAHGHHHGGKAEHHHHHEHDDHERNESTKLRPSVSTTSSNSRHQGCCKLLITEQDSLTNNSHNDMTIVCHSTPICPSTGFAEPERCETDCDQVEEDPPILMKSHPHAHSHGIRSLTFVLAISFHSIVEGLALGVQKDTTRVTTLFLSLMVHKLIVAFSVGLQLARTHAHAIRWVVASILLLAVMTPLGAVIGMFVHEAPIDSHTRDFVVLLFQGVAVGTFIYVTFFEVLIHERDNEHPNLLKILFMLVGFALIGCLRLIDHGHDHGHGDAHHEHHASHHHDH
uniref:Zinc transporter ZIP3 n=1 Tax=Panagrellus redivivus TaxID=6233 RepID=A0A7E4V3N3_PANRE